MNDIIEKAVSGFSVLSQLAMVAALGVSGWVLQSVGSLNTKVEVLSATVSFNMSDRYRGEDAKRDLSLRDLKIESLDQRIRDLEHEVRTTKIDVKQQEQKIEQVVPKRRP